METVTPLIPTSAWLFAVAIATSILLIALLLYLFNHRRIAVITELGGNVADLIAKEELLKADIDVLSTHILGQREELLRVDGEREQQESLRLELDELTRKIQTMDNQNQTLRNEVGQLELEKIQHSEKMRQITEETQKAIQQRDAAAEELKTLQEEITERRNKNSQELSHIEEEHKKAIEERIQALNEKLQQKKEAVTTQAKEHNTLKKDIEKDEVRRRELREKIADYEVRLQSLGGECANKESRLSDLQSEMEAMQHRKSEIGQEIENIDIIHEKLSNARGQLIEIEDKITFLEKKEQNLQNACALQENLRETLSETLTQKKSELAEFEKKLLNSIREHDKMIQVERRRDELERAVSRLEIEENRLQDHINELREKLHNEDATSTEKNIKSFSDLLIEPTCLKPEEFSAKALQQDEVLTLQKFKDHLAKEGLVFPDRVVNAFHTSLKCADINPLTVLAGVSGTGKTLLPIKYARLMGMHSLVMAVQPRWDSPQDMFGFYNYLEKKYKATDLARALVRMDEYHSFTGPGGTSKERMFLVLMDEMNLARTEYYFSEFLSKLELRRDVKDPSDPSDRERAEVVLDLGLGGTENSRLWIGSNVLFVGTMNEDETTQSLSDKVLDRSNVLRFGKPANRLTDTPHFHEPIKAPGFLTHELWKSWIHDYNKQAPWSRTVAEWTEKVNSALQRVGRPFGYRVEKAIRAYVANYPGVETGKVYKQAFADQIEQKILPKLRGLELSDSLTAQCLDDISLIITELEDSLLTEAFDFARQPNNVNMFIWHGVSRS